MKRGRLFSLTLYFYRTTVNKNCIYCVKKVLQAQKENEKITPISIDKAFRKKPRAIITKAELMVLAHLQSSI